MKIIISLVGHPASGKTSAARYLEEKYGFTTFTFSKAIREYAARNNIELKRRADYANTHTRMLKEQGWDYTLKLALSQDVDRLCIDDVRSPRFAEVLRSAGSIDIAFDCPSAVRFAHAHGNADRAKYPTSQEAFDKNERDDNEVVIGPGLGFNTDQVMKTANYHIDASGTLNNTYEQLDKIITELIH
jgi:dephospho-CoA kinase